MYKRQTENGAATYDPEQAKKFLEEAGVKPGELEIECLAYKANYVGMAESIQSDLREIGINMTISSIEPAVFLEKTAKDVYKRQDRA